jgi:hypothetical protein
MVSISMNLAERVDLYLWQVDAGNNGDIQGRRGVLLGSRGIAVGEVLVLGIFASLPRLRSRDFANFLFLRGTSWVAGYGLKVSSGACSDDRMCELK